MENCGVDPEGGNLFTFPGLNRNLHTYMYAFSVSIPQASKSYDAFPLASLSPLPFKDDGVIMCNVLVSYVGIFK